MKSLLIVFGIILTILSFVTIVKEMENYTFAEKHPVERRVFGSPNPDLKGYSYTSPFTTHELFMITGLCGGIALFVVGIKFKKAEKKKEKEETIQNRHETQHKDFCHKGDSSFVQECFKLSQSQKRSGD